MTRKKATRKKYFVSFIIGYFPALHSFAPYQNYYLYPSILAQELAYTPIILIKEGQEHLYADPNLPKDILVIEYKNIFQFIFLLIKYSLLRSIFYINNHQIVSYCALIITKIFFCDNVFMGHIQPKRTTMLRQCVFDIVLLFTSRIRVNNSSEKEYLLSRNTNAKKIHIVPIAINTKAFYVTETDYTKRRGVFYYGNLTKQKGIPTIFKAIQIVQKQIPDIQLHLVGSQGDYYPDKDIQDLSLTDTVVKHGQVRHGMELNALLNRFSVFVIDTKAEGQCMTVYEAALSGNALCLPNIMSFNSVFKGKALLHELGIAEELARNIITYLQNSEKIKEDNMCARKMIEEEYSEQTVKIAFVKLLTF